jgi:hypothetical protein
LEKYITDDVERHGKRLAELEKKITNAYQEFTNSDAIDDDTLFANEDDEEEESAFVMYALYLSVLGRCNTDIVVRVGANSRMTLEKISWACANLVLLPSSAFPLSRSPNDSSKARGMPRAQMQRMKQLSPLLLSISYSLVFSQFKVRRAPSAISPTTPVYSTYCGEREGPDRLASWLL